MSSRQSVPQQESNAKPETVQPSIPEQEIVQSDGHVIQRLISSGAGAPNDPLPNRIQNLPPSQRKQAILQMQRTHGNAYVQRMLNASPDAIQRAPAGYSLLKQHLDAPMDLHFDRIYVIGQDDYDWIN